MTKTPFRCSEDVKRRGESFTATASAAHGFLAVEDPGPWGHTAWKDAQIPADVAASVRAQATALKIRAVLIRRSKESTRERRRVFFAHSVPGAEFVETTVIDDFAHVADFDLRVLAAGKSLGLSRGQEPIYLTCTHGKHDPCCAINGRPAYESLAELAPEATWETSHLGGDRFSANVAVLPYGLYYGGLDADSVGELVAAHERGELLLEHLRGRNAFPTPAQAAEIMLREKIGELRIAAPNLGEITETDEGAVVHLSFDGDQYEVELERTEMDPAKLSCGSKVLSSPVAWNLVAVR